MSTPLVQADIEQEIMRISDRLEEMTEEYADVCDAAADAEATYRVRYFKGYLARKDQAHEGRGPSDKTCEAQATIAVENELRDYKRTAGAADAMKQAIYTQRARMDALRTIAANIRSQT